KAHGGTGRPEDGVLIPIFFGDFNAPFLRVDTSCIKAQDEEAEVALEYLIWEMNRVACEIVLEQGDLLLLDNHVVVHGRTPFPPRFDGTDRWLQRASITANFRKLSGVDMFEPRVIKMVV
nr:TauD/TfdA family dioxygenase [Ktedonobacteraceae bacterium]